jgi:hypothetical protein
MNMTKIAEFMLFSYYSLINIYPAGIGFPYFDWTQQEIDQGFICAPNGVCLRVLSDAGDINIEIFLNGKFPESSQATRAFYLPFKLDTSLGIIVCDSNNGFTVPVPKNQYVLYCETGFMSESSQSQSVVATWCRFHFIESDNAGAEITITNEFLKFPKTFILRNQKLECSPVIEEPPSVELV